MDSDSTFSKPWRAVSTLDSILFCFGSMIYTGLTRKLWNGFIFSYDLSRKKAC
jgi:hypothetical protein